MPEDNFQLNTPALPGTVMPFSAEAEQAVLGAVLLEPDCLSTVAEMLPRADYFYQVNNRTIYSAMLDMFTAGQPVDLVTLLEHLREEENFDEGSGKVYLMQLAQLVPSVSNVERYCTIVRVCSFRRRAAFWMTPWRTPAKPRSSWILPSSAFLTSARARR